MTPQAAGVGRTPINVAVDHLPPAIRRALLSGATLADFGAESDDYLKLLGLTPHQGGGILSIRGLTLDGELAGFVPSTSPVAGSGIVSSSDWRRRSICSLAFERIAEHDARFEAVQALEELTRNIHAEYNNAVRGTQGRARRGPRAKWLARRRRGSASPELERLCAAAKSDADASRARLTAVEEQVAHAVSRLEEAHMELHSQGERSLADQGRALYEIERALDQGDPPDEIIRKIRAAFSARS